MCLWLKIRKIRRGLTNTYIKSNGKIEQKMHRKEYTEIIKTADKVLTEYTDGHRMLSMILSFQH